MHISKSQLLRCGVTLAVVLLVGWGIWQCQSHRSLLDLQMFYPASHVKTSEYGWPMFHTHEIETADDIFVPASARYERSALFPGVLVNASVWCLVLVATGCVAWRWTAHGRQWRLRTLFGVSIVVAILLGWWRWEYNAAVRFFPPKYAGLYTTLSDAPMLTLLYSPWYVYIPVLFGLGCGIFWIGWIGGIIVSTIGRVIHHVAMSKLR